MDDDIGNQDSTSPSEQKKQLAFVLILKNYKVLLDKSQVPAVKAKKQAALAEMSKELKLINGVDVTTAQLSKKINNMKTHLKKKVDKNATGNKKIILCDWEKEFLDLLSDDNPTLARIPGEYQNKNRFTSATTNLTIFVPDLQEEFQLDVTSRRNLSQSGHPPLWR